MSIDQRGERTWRFRVKHKWQLYTMTYEAPPDLNGKALDKEVERQHMIFKADVVAGRINLTKNITMSQLADTVYKEYVLIKLKVNTQRVYETAYNKYILPEFGVMDLKDIKPIHIQKFANKLSKTLKPNTVGQIRNEKGELEDAATSTKTPTSKRKIYAPQFVTDCLKDYISTLPYIPISKQIY